MRSEREWTVTASVNAYIEMHVTLLDRTVTGATRQTYSVKQALQYCSPVITEVGRDGSWSCRGIAVHTTARSLECMALCCV